MHLQRALTSSDQPPGSSRVAASDAISALAEGALRDRDVRLVAQLIEAAYLGGLRRWVRAQLFRRGCPHDELDDLVQEVFRRVLLSRERYRGSTEGEFWAYMSGITRSVLGNEWRRRARRPSTAPETGLRDATSCRRTGRHTAAPGASEVAQRVDAGTHVEEACDESDLLVRSLLDLTPTQRSIIMLRYGSGLSLRAVAEALGRAPSTVAEAEKAALARLQGSLSEVIPAEPGIEIDPDPVQPVTTPASRTGRGRHERRIAAPVHLD